MSLLDDPSTMKMVCLLADAIAAETRPAIGGIRRYICRAEFSRQRNMSHFGSPVDDENSVLSGERCRDEYPSRHWRDQALHFSGGIFEVEKSRDRGAKRLPGIAERQLGILNLSAFPYAGLTLGDPNSRAI